MKKRLLPISLLCLVGFLAGCNQPSGSSGSGSNPNPSSSPSSVAPSSSSPSSQSSSGGGGGSQVIPVTYELEIVNKDVLTEPFNAQNKEGGWYVQDGTRTVSYYCNPGTARNLVGSEIFLYSSDPTIVSVTNDSIITPLKKGKVTLTAIYHNAIDYVRVEVNDTERPVNYTSIEEVAKGVANNTILGTAVYDIKGTVTGIYGRTAIIQEGAYAMYIYNANYEGIQVGDAAHARSSFQDYNGLVETKSGSTELFVKLDENAEQISATTITDLSQITKADCSKLVNISGLVSNGYSLDRYGCGPQATSSLYRCSSVKFGDTDTYVFVNKYLDAATLAAINEKLNRAEENGMKISLKNAHVYSSTVYTPEETEYQFGFSITSADQISLSDSDPVIPTSFTLKSDKKEIVVQASTQLTATFQPENCNRKGLIYESSDPTIATVDETGVVTGLKEGKVTITAKSEVKPTLRSSIELTVFAPDYVIDPVNNGVYYLGISQDNLNKTIYATGAMDGYYLATSEDITKAVPVTFLKSDNGVALKAGEKYLRVYANGTYVNIDYTDQPVYFTFDEETYAFKIDITDCQTASKNGTYYLGTSGTYRTISANKDSALFPARLYPFPNDYVESIEVGSNYYLGLYQDNLDQFTYSNGQMDNTYGAGVSSKEQAAVFTVLAGAEADTYYFKTGNKYLAIETPSGKTFQTMKFQDEPFAWKWDEELKAPTAFFANNNKLFGTSNTRTFTTFSVINKSAAGNNFILRCYQAAGSEPVQPTGPTTVHAGTVEDPFDIKDAIAACQFFGSSNSTDSYFIKGRISKIDTAYDSGFKNVSFSMIDLDAYENSKEVLKVFRLNAAEGAEEFTQEVCDGKIKVGYEVVVYGKLVNYQSNTPEIPAGGKVISSKEGTIPESPATGADAQVKSVVTTNTNAAADNLSANLNLDGTNFVATYDKNGASSDMAIRTDGIRMYATKESSNGNKLTITSKVGNISKIEIDFDSASYSSTAQIIVNDQVVAANADGSYTINAASFTIFNNNINVTSNTQVRFQTIDIYLVK